MLVRVSESPVECLIEDVQVGLSSVRLAQRAEDPWFASRNRSKARQAYEDALRQKGLLEQDSSLDAHLLNQLDQLRRALQAA